MKRLLVAASAACLLFTAPTLAQKGIKGDPEIGKKLWSFNVLVRPNSWDDTGNACNGARIFYGSDSGGVGGTLMWTLNPDAAQNFRITDCNGTDGSAAVEVDENQGNVIVAIRVLGPRNSHLSIACTSINPNIAEGEELCIQDQTNLDRNKSFTKMMKNIADNELENVLWTFDSTNTWKIFQVRVYEYIR
jgi:hypothetical protein